ncbi:MAG: cell wall hydrolase [Sphingomonas sp.]
MAIAVIAVAGPALVLYVAPPVTPHRRLARAPLRVIPKAELPPVEPVAFQDLAPDDARAFNASIPFVDGPVAAARPFHFAGDGDERARATDCLATAALFEAGDDAVGERAVAQVILNRARHPAFPKTVCGVVFQGSERSTGCQFTFTCDGALATHRWSALAWTRAREVAAAALSGTVYRPVGYATHYHTDWVVPYWQSSLDKIAAVHSHLFFRWTGWWGTAPAFGRAVSSDEPVIPALAALSDAHRAADAVAETDVALAAAAAVTGGEAAVLRGDPNSFVLKLDPKSPADRYALIAEHACGDRPYCKVMGWTDKARLPTQLPLQAEQVGTMSFSYLRDRSHDFDKALWNCAEFKRVDKAQCMKQQIIEPAVIRPFVAPQMEIPSARHPLVAPPIAPPRIEIPSAKHPLIAPALRIEPFRPNPQTGSQGAIPPPAVPTQRKTLPSPKATPDMG